MSVPNNAAVPQMTSLFCTGSAVSVFLVTVSVRDDTGVDSLLSFRIKLTSYETEPMDTVQVPTDFINNIFSNYYVLSKCPHVIDHVDS